MVLQHNLPIYFDWQWYWNGLRFVASGVCQLTYWYNTAIRHTAFRGLQCIFRVLFHPRPLLLFNAVALRSGSYNADGVKLYKDIALKIRFLPNSPNHALFLVYLLMSKKYLQSSIWNFSQLPFRLYHWYDTDFVYHGSPWIILCR